MTPDPHSLLTEALSAHGCDTGTLHILDNAGGDLRLVAHVGLPPHVAQIVQIVPVGKGMAGLAAERREPVQTCNLQTDTTGDIRPGAKAVPVRASVAVPLLIDGQLRGVLGFGRADVHEWSADDIAGLGRTAASVAARM